MVFSSSLKEVFETNVACPVPPGRKNQSMLTSTADGRPLKNVAFILKRVNEIGEDEHGLCRS